MRISDWSSDVCSSDLGRAPYCEQENLVLTDVRRDGDRCALGDIRVHQYIDLDFERRDVLAAAANHVLDAVCKDVVALRCPNEGVAGMEPTVTPGHCGCFGVVEVACIHDPRVACANDTFTRDRKSTRLNSSH